jgi:uncharacterized protein
MYDPLITPDTDARRWAMFCHLGGLAGPLTTVPFANVIVPLVIWLAKRDEHPFIDDQGKEALNFQIATGIYYTLLLVAAVILTFVLIGIFLWPFVFAIWLWQVIGAIYGAIKANDGQAVRFPFIFRLVS